MGLLFFGLNCCAESTSTSLPLATVSKRVVQVESCNDLQGSGAFYRYAAQFEFPHFTEAFDSPCHLLPSATCQLDFAVHFYLIQLIARLSLANELGFLVETALEKPR